MSEKDELRQTVTIIDDREAIIDALTDVYSGNPEITTQLYQRLAAQAGQQGTVEYFRDLLDYHFRNESQRFGFPEFEYNILRRHWRDFLNAMTTPESYKLVQVKVTVWELIKNRLQCL